LGAIWREAVWWVELAPVSDPAHVPRTVALVLGVHEQVGSSLGDLLRDHLEPRRLLLILDNCATLANRLLRACPDLRILATSRESMGIAGENVVLELSLSLPDGVLGAEVCDIESRIGRGVGIEPSSRPGVYP
jgi:predicted ATPase